MRWIGGFVTIVLTFAIARGQSSDQVIDDVIQEALEHVHAEDDLLETRHAQGIDKRPENFQTIQSSMFEATPTHAVKIEEASRVINWISFLIKKNNLTVTLRDVLTHQQTLVKCPYVPPPRCNSTLRYRSINGTCNNLGRPLQGASNTPFIRELDPAYETAPNNTDINDQPRTTGRNGGLPDPRTISRGIHQQVSLQRQDSNMSFFFVDWGQFLAHIITDKAPGTGANFSRVDCCNQTHRTPQSECVNIDIAPGDPFRETGRTCLPVERSLEATDLYCEKGRREQINSATSYIDASAVYGTTDEQAAFLRTHTGGELAMSEPGELPYKSHGNKLAEKHGFAFVQAGDPRAAEVSPLLGMHTLWVREHNRIARELAQLNPSWNDEKLYQESRRIVSALIQHITYKEWLPPLIGHGLMFKYNLEVYRQGYYGRYNPSIDATTSNIVATAAMRFGHTLVTSVFPLCHRDYSLDSRTLQLKDLFLKPNMYLLNEQRLMRGLLVKRSESMDAFVTPNLTNSLLQTRNGNGADLVAINIQRGREHGLPSYNTWRRFYNLTVGTSFTSTGLPDIPSDTTQALSSVYSHPEDIDVWTGGVSEDPVSDGLIGPLFGNILGRQFQRFRRGDRFWYETGAKYQRFTFDQLNSLRNTTLARIICNHFDIDTIQPQAFKLVQADNRLRNCSEIASFNLTLWQEGST